MSEENKENEYTTPWVRHLVLGLGFLFLLVVGVWTVVLPAVEDSPVDPENTAESEEPAESDENPSDSEG